MSTSFINVDDICYKSEWISLREWREEWNTCPIQRDHKARAKRKSNQQKFSRLTPDHLEVRGAILGCDCVDPYTGIQYKKGTKFKTDAHTRDLIWQNGFCLDGQPEKVHVSYQVVNSIDAVRQMYSWFDSPLDVEKASDRLDGAYRNAFTHKGKYVTHERLRKVYPIEYAACGCYPDRYVRARTSDNTSIIGMVQDLEFAIFWLQDVYNDAQYATRKNNKLQWQVAFTDSFLMSAMKYANNEEALIKLKDFIIRVSNCASNNDVEIPDACTRFIEEWSDAKKSNYVQGGVLNGSVASVQMEGFNLLMIDSYVQDKKYQVVPNNWRKYYSTWQDEFLKVRDQVTLMQFI